MVDLLQAIRDFFDGANKADFERKVRAACQILPTINGSDNLASYWSFLSADVRADGRVAAAYKEAQERTKSQGEIGILGDLAKGLFEGFAALSGPIEAALAESLRKNLVPGSPDTKHEFDGVVEVLLDGMLQAFRVGGKEVPTSVRDALKTSLIPVVQLGLTITVATSLAELIHPTKELGLNHVSHLLYDMCGFKSISEAYTWPLRKALIEYPIQVALNTALQPYYPSEGTITGLARKREVTQEQYRDSMRALGIREEWITGQLQGFWADPRLFEIVRILDVAMPDPTCPSEAAVWLERAKLGKYIGPDWWLALKFAKAGYDDIDIPVLIQAVRKRYIQSELGNIRGIQRTQYKKGKISRPDYEAILASRGISAAESRELLDAVETEQTGDISDDLQRLYELKYLNGRLTDEALLAAFRSLKLDDGYIDARIKYLAEKRLGKLREDLDTRIPTRSDLEQTYKDGRSTKEAYIDRLDQMGYTLADAQLIADNAEYDLILDVAQEWQRTYEYRTRYGRMTASDLTLALIGLGKSDAYAAARAAYIAEMAAGKTGEVEAMPE